MPIAPGEYRRVFDSVISKVKRPTTSGQCSEYILDVVNRCKSSLSTLTPGQLGRIIGDWFEWTIAICLDKAFGRNVYETSSDLGGKTRNIPGFETGFVRWLPCPDIILKNRRDYRVVLSAKWGLRPDRRFAEPYIAMKIRTITPTVKYLILTNTTSSPNAQVLMEAPEIDKVYHLRPNPFGSKLKGISDVPTLIDDLSTIIGVKSNL